MARPTELTPKLHKDFVKLLADGATIADACAHVGITDRTYYNWIRRGERARKGDESFMQFFQASTRARVQARLGAIGIIRKAIRNGDVSAAQWYLERSDPENWGRRTYSKIEGLEPLLQLARDKGISHSDLFNAIIAELASVSSDDSEEGG